MPIVAQQAAPLLSIYHNWARCSTRKKTGRQIRMERARGLRHAWPSIKCCLLTAVENWVGFRGFWFHTAVRNPAHSTHSLNHPPPSSSLSHTHTLSTTLHPLSLSLTHSLESLSHTHTLSLTHTHTALSLSHTHSLSFSLSHTCTPRHITHTHSLSLTHTHTLLYTPPPPFLPPPPSSHTCIHTYSLSLSHV